MNQNLNLIQEKKQKDLEFLNPESIYSHDAVFFSTINKNETWDFSQNREISITGLSFLFARSLLSESIYGNKILVSSIDQPEKAKIAKLGFSYYYNNCLQGFPVLGIAEKEKMKSSLESIFLEEKSFHLEESTRKTRVLTGGGILTEEKSNAHSTVENLFQNYSLRNETGHFFLRTKTNSYLYLLNPENKSKTFYIQQKNSFSVDFQFYHIKIYK